MSLGLLCPSDLLPAKRENESNQTSRETGQQVKAHGPPIEGARGPVSGQVLLFSLSLNFFQAYHYVLTAYNWGLIDYKQNHLFIFFFSSSTDKLVSVKHTLHSRWYLGNPLSLKTSTDELAPLL